MAEHILLLEDEPSLARNLLLNLRAEGYVVDHAADIATAHELISTNTYQLYLLDWMLPDGSGRDLSSELRTQAVRAPICLLTARTATEDVVAGLEAGADDYIGKPFALEELLGRIAALLRRAAWSGRQPSVNTETLTFGPNSIHLGTGESTTATSSVRLTSLELRLMRFLFTNKNSVVSRNDLLREVWDVAEPDRVRTRSVDTFIARLRKYFEADPSKPQFILTEHGTGYRFLPDSPP